MNKRQRKKWVKKVMERPGGFSKLLMLSRAGSTKYLEFDGGVLTREKLVEAHRLMLERSRSGSAY